MFRIGSIDVDPPLVLAPMAGITDHVYRLMLRRIGGVGIVTMEFISSEAITRGNARQLRKMVFTDEERPLSIQIYGSDPERMAAAADIVEELSPDVCDINMGCPANKVLKGCAGAALMGDPNLARTIVRQVRSRLSIPLTVKFRLGLDDARRNYLEIGRVCQGEGAAAVAMHGRTARQMYNGRADWDEIGELKRALTIPVIGNGDVETADDAVALLARTGCDGVMVGRASMKNPWIFRQIADRLAGRPERAATLEERRDLMLAHFRAIEETAADAREMLHKLRTMTGWYTRGLPNGRALRVRISELSTGAAFREAVEEFFDGQLAGNLPVAVTA
ncbi:MAG TPA: tRNA dihydrouridine synthase DusB [Thermoanaerobaculia bacterium]|nr:tRNA dihydrouridine synthase DusB [Thermoanaerobaculia bacterium]